MKIKTTKKLNLPELIQYVWENDFYPTEIKNDGGRFRVKFGQDALVSIIDCRGVEGRVDVPMNINFTVEVEEELAEDTELERITIFFYDTQTKNNSFGTYRDLSIQEALEMNRGTLKFISMAVDDVLIWSRDSGIPESGVLEADDE